MIGATDVARVRSFNRLVTERVGALADRFLGRARPLGECRLLWEIGRGEVEIRELRSRLGLDSAYVSRMLRSLEAQGLVAVAESASDGRVRHVRLTAAGRKERAVLDRASDAFARSMLEPLTEDQRTRLTAAMAEVERLLVASMVTIDLADPTSAGARVCLAEYFAELEARFEGGFDAGRALPVHPSEVTPPSGALLLASLRHEPVGCGSFKLHDGGVAELKRIWVAPAARGLGLGRRLLEELERRARECGATVARLDTNKALTEAISLYRRSGYREVAPFNHEPHAHHWFEKTLATS
jgi:DNA-binding MarR family transcriptional regulator/GNAT superfamily N-acetyltransferase